MFEQSPNVETDRGHSEEGESDGLDLERMREMVGFALRAARRRLVLAVTTFVVVAGLGITAAKIMPRTYNAQVILFAQRSTPVRLLSSPNPGVDQVDNPTKNAVAMVMRRDNLVALAKDASLVERFHATRSPALRLKDRIRAQFFGSPSDEDMLTSMVYTLENQLKVEIDDTTVTISVDWANPQIAYDLVTLVQKNFSEARYDNDVAVVTASLAVLEEHAKNELARVDDELKEYNKQVMEKAKLTRTASVGGATARVSRIGARVSDLESAGTDDLQGPDPELAATLEEKRLRIRAIEESRQRTVDALRLELQKQQLQLTPAHPAVIALEQQLTAASQPSPELMQLQGEVRALTGETVRPKATSIRSAAPLAAALPPVLREPSAPGASASADAPSPLLKEQVLAPLALSGSRLSLAMRGYEDALARLDAARVELDVTRAVSQHRYMVLTPAVVPNGPKKATARLLSVGSVVGGALLAILLAAGLDLLGGTVIEPWQIRRQLKVDILSELDGPS
jgi:uncharacterized protein involved in exopolysaccharide biosynthesis